GGLTEFGRQAVRRMNKLGIAIDVSHSGDQTSLDTIQASEKPIFITHAGARALWDTKRMKPDEVIKAMAAKGGVIGIEAAPHTTLTKKHPKHNIESYMEHFEYCADLVGIEHVAFGPDTLFGDHVGLHHYFAMLRPAVAPELEVRADLRDCEPRPADRHEQLAVAVVARLDRRVQALGLEVPELALEDRGDARVVVDRGDVARELDCRVVARGDAVLVLVPMTRYVRVRAEDR